MTKYRFKNIKISNFIFVAIILLLLIPQTRMPVQTAIHQLIAKTIPVSLEDEPTSVDYETWILKGVNGTQLNFHDLNNKVVVINFWATWCPPCLAEMTSLNDLYNKFKDEDDIVFLYISNEETEVLHQFLSKKEYIFEPFQSFSRIPSDFEHRTIPRTFIIDKNGNKVVDSSTAADWNSEEVNKLLKDLIKS